MDKQYIVLGLGTFGYNVALTLAEYDKNVIAVDSDLKKVEDIADFVDQANVIDCTDIDSLKAIGAGDCDTAIVSLSSHLESAILTVLNLKKLGIKNVIVKAKDNITAEVLQKIGADNIIYPEKEMAIRLGKTLLNGNLRDIIDLDSTHSVMEIEAPEIWWGKTLRELDTRKQYSINILGIRENEHRDLDVSFSPDFIVKKGNLLVVFADSKVAEIFNIKYY